MRALFGIAMGGEWGVGAALGVRDASRRRARIFLRPAAGGLRRRISFRRPGLWHALPFRGLARHVCDRGTARVSRDLHSHQGRRVSGVAAGKNFPQRARSSGQRHPVARRNFPFPDRTDVRLQLLQPRHAGSLPNIHAEKLALHHQPGQPGGDHLQRRRTVGRNSVWQLVGAHRAAARHCDRGPALDSSHSALGVSLTLCPCWPWADSSCNSWCRAPGE